MCVTSESNLLVWGLDVAYFREKNELIFYALAGPVKKMATPQHKPRHTELTKLHSHKIPRRLHKQKKSNNKAHTLMIKLAMYSNICLAFNLFLDLSCSNDYGVPCKFAIFTTWRIKATYSVFFGSI